MKITTVGIDLAKSVFHVFAVNKMGTLVKKKQLKRKELLTFIAQLEPCRIAMESCGGAHHWAREFTKLGHEVKLIAPHYVKPDVKGNKNDYLAQGCAGAVEHRDVRERPTMPKRLRKPPSDRTCALCRSRRKSSKIFRHCIGCVSGRSRSAPC